MLVYGDPQFDCQLRELARSLHSQLSAVSSFDELRSVLIRAGQLEQGLADSTFSSPSAHLQASSLVENLAAQFYENWKNAGDWQPCAITTGNWSKINDAVQALVTEANVDLTVKVPEGFEFYSLFPEQYCLSAERWCAENQPSVRRAVVVGIRSIGTTLSALVAAVLRAHRWSVLRLTVRPSGHPFTRKCHPFANVASYSRALIVDEGPGLSGSSMASVADALASAGAQSICLFPGHPGMPGHQAAPSVFRVWKTLPRYTSPVTELRWGGKSLEESLAASSSYLVRSSDQPVLIDVGAGKWREYTGVPVGSWPEVTPAFESAKALAIFPSESILWKFFGLGSWRRAPSSDGVRKNPTCALQPVAHGLGYAAFRWVIGPRPCMGKQTPEVLETVASYLVQSARPPLRLRDHQAGVQRLSEMLFHNTREALGDSAAARTAEFAELAWSQPPGPTYSDGHMGPWEWVATGGGLIKTDAADETVDHTLVGRQSILWDLAAVQTEWKLPEDQAGWLSDQIRQKLGTDLEALTFYRLAWCALRLGALTIAVQGGLSADDLDRANSRISELKESLAAALIHPSAVAL